MRKLTAVILTLCVIMQMMALNVSNVYARDFPCIEMNPSVNSQANMRVDEFIAVLSHYSYWSQPSAAPYSTDKYGQQALNWAAPYVQTEINKGVIKPNTIGYSDTATIAFAARYMSNAKGKYQWDFVNDDYKVTGAEGLSSEDKMYLYTAFDYGLIPYYEGINVNTPFKRADIPSLDLTRTLLAPRKRTNAGSNENFIVNAFFEGRNDISDTKTQYDTLVKYKDKIDHVSFYGASLVGDGSVETNYESDDYTAAAITYCKQNNIKPLLALQNYKNNTYNADVVKNALEFNMSKSVESVIAEVDKYDLYGVNIVFEFTYDSLRDKQTEFARQLSQRLKAKGKILMVTVGAYFDDNSEQASLYDYSALGSIADYVSIILYDDNSSNAYNSGKINQPGCTSNLVRIDRVVKYAKMKIPSNKILLALGYYGVDFDLSSHRARNISFAEVYNHALQSTSGWVCDATEGSGHFNYGNNHVVYCETEAGLKERITYSKNNSLGGMSYFSLSSDLIPFFRNIR